MQVKKQHLDLDMEQWTGLKLRKQYDQAVHCHAAYLTYMQNASWEMLGWMNHKLESRLPGEISTTSNTPQSSILAWKISWTEEPGGLQPMGSQRVEHDWATNTLTHTQICRWYHCNGRKWRGINFLIRVKEESEKAGMKLNINKQTNKQTKN